MLIIKMMSSEDLPDHLSSKCYDLIFATEDALIEMLRAGEDDPVKPGAPIIRISYPGDQGAGTCWYPDGNTYIMNEQGKTISSFAYSECQMSLKAATVEQSCGDVSESEQLKKPLSVLDK